MTLVCLLIAMTAFRAESAERKQDPPNFHRQIQPLLAAHCYRCHRGKKTEGNLDLSLLNADMIGGSDAETWHDVLNKVQLEEMPPEDEPPLKRAERDTLTKWLTGELRRAAEARRATGGRIVLRRLTRYEYQNTMRDLIGLDMDYAAELPPESVSPDGFQNNGASLGISSLQIEYYLAAARAAMQRAIVAGPRPQVHQATQKVKPTVEPKSDDNKKNKKRKAGKGTASTLNPGDQNSYYEWTLKDFPRSGDVLIRVTATMNGPLSADYPRLQVALGVKSDVRTPVRMLGELDVTSDKPTVYEFRGRIEDFPLPGKRPKFPGLRVQLRNVYEEFGNGRSKNSGGRNRDKSQLPTIELKELEFIGPVMDAWPPSSHTRIFVPRDESFDNDHKYVQEVLRRFMRRAYRRPITEAEVNQAVVFYDRIRPRFDSLEKAVGETLAMVLISPEFLYLVEPRSDKDGRQSLNNHELAVRLSYFLWSTMPDETLSNLADEGNLSDPNVLREQVQRMLSDDRSTEFVRRFSDQWLDLSGLTRVAVNPQFYPGFDDQIKAFMRLETHHFFAEILREKMSAMNFLTSEFVMLNRPLARHYGLEGPRGLAFERVAVPDDSPRGGLLTQGSFALANSNGEDSHPIRRAVWILDRLLDDPPAPPPPDVPALDSKDPDLAGLSLKKQLEVHRNRSACNNCHRGIDPWGVALENLDAVGAWRETVVARGRKPTPVDATTELPDGTAIDGAQSLQQYLVTDQRNRFARSLTKRLLVYSLGRSVELADEPVVERLTTQFEKENYRLGKLITNIVLSEPFRTK